ncbi:hypothetical protein FA95DRAFT_1579796 [Auriscalpium vulgare]|uniref:Uncharacterized protein n=1 Tax=Auriscalpium vulgare TaxID=40419 RepID=A0ACB8S865_9AGAM|nr:hypothetical protein FA95DRAFT_1579796 [Auriscalpium vulgare]
MSFSDWSLSDLTDLSSDDDYDAPVSRSSNTKKSALKKTKGSTYTIANSLRPPRTTQYSAKSLYEQIMDNSIDLEADYQRDVVWPEPKQVGLIDSVFRNYYVPPVIFAVTTAEDGSETRVCIDGKQRLTSIQNVTNKKYWYKREGAGAKTMLPGPLVASFANKQIVCVEYDYLSDDQEREIFQRVQLGVALTPAERMQAITGPWPSFIRELQSQVVGVDGFGDALDWGRARGRDFQGLASIVFVIEKLPTFSLPVSPALDKWLSRTIAVPKKLRNDVFETFRIFLRLAKDKKYNAAFHKPTRVSPIEFIMIAVLIYTRRQKSSLMQLSSAIEQMRADVRTKEKDVRTNARVSKALLKFITEKRRQGRQIGGICCSSHEGHISSPSTLEEAKANRHQR